ncbi:MAG TPA: RsbRD N-terminal domain-containing protein [Bryobacteraceae bacterium]|nr:RsbRD N-terminal domain-containing protein [Bryobacteraceae bacterium]
MLFNRLIQAVEEHSEEIVTTLVTQVRKDPELKHLNALPDPELRQRASAVVTRLSTWLGHHDNIGAMYSELGRIRFQQHVPLHECVREILLLKHTVVDFVREHSFSNTQVELYAEEEVEHLVHSCFDRMLYHFVRGYEEAAARPAAAARHAG